MKESTKDLLIKLGIFVFIWQAMVFLLLGILACNGGFLLSWEWFEILQGLGFVVAVLIAGSVLTQS